MADESKLMTQANRGERATRILEDPVFVEAIDKIEASLIGVFKDSKLADDDGRRYARESLGLLTLLREELRHVMITGSDARKELLRIRKESKLRSMINGR